jgi:anti-anti-sigma regulatory factor
VNLSTRQAGTATIVDVNGDITLYNAPQLRAMLVEQLKDKRAVRLIFPP